MESSRESERLLLKSDESSTREQLLSTGLEAGMQCLDAGGGAGFVTRIMSDIVGAPGRVTLYDQSATRLDAAKKLCESQSNVDYEKGDLDSINLPPNTYDYVFCRFVFEYLNDQEGVFKNLLRVTKPGGKIVIGDLDYNVLTHYPLAPNINQQLIELSECLNRIGLWDPFAGRKLYSYFHRENLVDIRVQVIPHHLIYGNVSERDLRNLEAKLDQMLDLQKNGKIKLSFDMKIFRSDFLDFFKNPGRFSYTPLILVDGKKPPEAEF